MQKETFTKVLLGTEGIEPTIMKRIFPRLHEAF